MADFASLVADVISLTNHPELVGETALAVKSATLKMHSTDFYFKDLFETAIQYSEQDYIQVIEYRTLFPKYRSLKYLRKFDAPTNTPGVFFDLVTPEEILDSYKAQRSNVCYVAGSVIQVRSNTPDLYALIGVYLSPTVDSPETYNSWIALEQPYAIVFEAAAMVYGLLENDKAKSAFLQEAADQISLLRMNNITAIGS